MKRTLLRAVLRIAGLVVLLFSATGLATDALHVMRSADDDYAGARPAPHDALHFPRSGRASLHLLLFGGILYVLPAAPLARKRRVVWDGRGPFDFQATFGPYIVHETVRRRILRWSLGLVCLLVGLCVGLLSRGSSENLVKYSYSAEEQATGWAVAWVEGVSSTLLVFTSWRLFARRAESVLRRNRRRPVLYLRSFQADVRMLGGVGDLFRLIFFGTPAESPERALAGSLTGVGPLVAVGQPREKLPPLGAARLYVRDDWQAVVAGLARASDLVVFRIGRTEGFWWEIRHVVSACDPRRVLIYLPKKDRENVYTAFWRRAAEVFPRRLPFRTGAALFLGFDADWNPRLLGIDGPSEAARGRWWLLGGSAPIVREALNETLKPLGLDARRLPWRWRETIALFCLLYLLFQCCFTAFAYVARPKAADPFERIPQQIRDR